MTQATIDSKMQLGQLLVARGVIAEEQVSEALNRQQEDNHRKLLGEILIELGHCTEDEIVSALAQCYGVPYAKVSPKVCDPKVLDVLPRNFIEDHLVLPVFKVHDLLTVAVTEPANLFLLDEIEQMTGYQVQLICTTGKDILATLRAYSPSANVFVTDECIEAPDQQDFELVEQLPQDVGTLTEAASQASIVELVHHLLREAVRDHASDIHIEPDDQSLRVRFRVHGKLFEKTRPPHQMHEAIVSRIKIMAEMDVAERAHAQEGTIRILMEEHTITMRVACLPGNCGEKVAIHIVDPQRHLFTLESLGFTIENLKRFRQILQVPQGLILLTGPAGSGKHTALHAALSELNHEHANLCTLENPLENNLPGVNQFEVGGGAGESFAQGLRHVLRQDPDVLMVSQLPDEETAQQAVRAALSGCLVLSTLHTSDATSGICRLLDLNVPSYLLSDALVAVLSQRLVYKICPECKTETEPSSTLRKAVEQYVEPIESYYQGVGCDQCRQTGFAGRIALHELLVPDNYLRHMIHDGIKETGLRHQAIKAGMIPLITDGLEKVRAGIVSLAEVFRTVPIDN
ncbi:GspE/PulE family protein [Planctomycetota bacterium]